MYKLFYKRVIDIVATMALCVILLPISLVMLAVMFIAGYGNPFFIQARPGKDGKLFRLIKFRTMKNTMDAEGRLLPDFERMTRLGNFLRRSSLDEIPQLINVLKGDMSLVGPRPLLHEYLALYNTYQSRRHEVLPGITGWAQVNGRNAISWNQKFEYDVWYVDHVSFKTDMWILWLTIRKAIKGGGVNASDKVTMEKFSSSENRNGN